MMRKPVDSEIQILKNQGCAANQWNDISITDNTDLHRLINVQFSGTIIILGNFRQDISFPAGYSKPAGIYNSYLHNCIVGDNVLISNVKTLANYKIENDVVIENVNSLVVEGETTFGNGTELEIVNEAGGRSLKIYDCLTAQIAYFHSLYRHDKEFIKNLEILINAYVDTKKASMGTIGNHVRIANVDVIKNVSIGRFAKISGSATLENGTVVSCKEAPTIIGAGVIAKDFIIHTGSNVGDFALLDKCFIGQSVKAQKQMSAENSAFFANSELFHGEFCSVLGGPYTVSHHKSTLLIAGLFSFFNAGSGSNQSNHMYKLGPVHQGILERGSKTGSFGYLLFPSRIGAFTAVIGKHYDNFDTTDLPFSYITEENGKSVLTPAMNLLTVGTKRDCEKWQTRDKRTDPNKLDLLSFDFPNPYVVLKMMNGYKILHNLYENASKKSEYVSYKGVYIKRLMLKTCAKYYEIGVKIFMGKCLVEQLEKLGQRLDVASIVAKLNPGLNSSFGEWVDICGLLSPAESIHEITNDIAQNKIASLEALTDRLKIIKNSYGKNEWTWCVRLIEKRFDLNFRNLTKEHLFKIIDDWKKNTIKLNNMILNDAKKEFTQNSMISFGIDGDNDVQKADFEAVRGNYEDNTFIGKLMDENVMIEKKADKIVALID